MKLTCEPVDTGSTLPSPMFVVISQTAEGPIEYKVEEGKFTLPA